MVGSFRNKYDSSAAQGLQAHITILYPFLPPSQVSADALLALERVFAGISGFTFWLTELRRFPGALYLAPKPDAPFKEMTRAVLEQFPGTSLYGGMFSDIIPHLTVAQVGDQSRADDVTAEMEHDVGWHLPLKANAETVSLMAREEDRWRVRAAFRLKLV
jgi:2'-5' RNA ligase